MTALAAARVAHPHTQYCSGSFHHLHTQHGLTGSFKLKYACLRCTGDFPRPPSPPTSVALSSAAMMEAGRPVPRSPACCSTPLSNRQAWRCWINQSSRDFCFTTETPATRGRCCRHYPRFLECGTKGTHSAPSLCVETHCHPAHYLDGSVRRHGTGTRRRQPTLRCRRFGRGADSQAMPGGCSLTCHRGQSTLPHQIRLWHRTRQAACRQLGHQTPGPPPRRHPGRFEYRPS